MCNGACLINYIKKHNISVSHAHTAGATIVIPWKQKVCLDKTINQVSTCSEKVFTWTLETETAGQGFDGLSKKLTKHISRLLRHILEMICVKAISTLFFTGSMLYVFFRNLRQDIMDPNLRRQ